MLKTCKINRNHRKSLQSVEDLRLYCTLNPSANWKCPNRTWWHVIRRAVQTKNPDMVWAVDVMRNIGSSGLTTGSTGAQEVLDLWGATVTGEPGGRTLGELFPNLSTRRLSRHRSWFICENKGDLVKQICFTWCKIIALMQFKTTKLAAESCVACNKTWIKHTRRCDLNCKPSCFDIKGKKRSRAQI